VLRTRTYPNRDRIPSKRSEVAVEWPFPFSPIEHTEDAVGLEIELQRELKSGHPLYGIPAAAKARRHDDVFFELLDGTGRIADIHLTWAGESERPPWPMHDVFESFDDWEEAVRDRYGTGPPP
jgi:hypothetical protein